MAERRRAPSLHGSPNSFCSLERLWGVLVKHYCGTLPLWLAPVQAMVVPIADRHIPYTASVRRLLGDADPRAEVDDRNERMNAKIRHAQL